MGLPFWAVLDHRLQRDADQFWRRVQKPSGIAGSAVNQYTYVYPHEHAHHANLPAADQYAYGSNGDAHQHTNPNANEYPRPDGNQRRADRPVAKWWYG